MEGRHVPLDSHVVAARLFSVLFIGFVEGMAPHRSRLACNMFDSLSMLARVAEFVMFL
jgi:hypothetical protein